VSPCVIFIDDFASSESVDSKYGCDRVRQVAMDGSGVKVVTSGMARQGFSLIKEFGFISFLNLGFALWFKLNLDGV
jgi:pyruvate/2-oxoglutarate/acetoin dehydrogenase E1 component